MDAVRPGGVVARSVLGRAGEDLGMVGAAWRQRGQRPRSGPGHAAHPQVRRSQHHEVDISNLEAALRAEEPRRSERPTGSAGGDRRLRKMELEPQHYDVDIKARRW